jgi:hypothetical protein
VIVWLARGLVSLGRLVVEKIAFAALVAVVVGAVLALVFGVIVAAGGRGRRAGRACRCSRFACAGGGRVRRVGVLLGTLGRDPGTAMLLAFLVALPLALPASCRARLSRGVARRPVPVRPHGDLFSGVLYDASPSALAAPWLVALTAAFGPFARLWRRLRSSAPRHLRTTRSITWRRGAGPDRPARRREKSRPRVLGQALWLGAQAGDALEVGMSSTTRPAGPAPDLGVETRSPDRLPA